MSFDPNKPSKEEGNFGQALDDTRNNLNDLNSRVSVQENLSLANVKNEVIAARGSRATVGDRISQFLGPDGNPNWLSLRSMLWPASNDTPTFVDGLSFTVAGDRTGTYLSGLVLRFTLGTSYAYAEVSTASYAAGTDKTTITLRRSVLTAALTAVSIGVASLNREDINIPALNKVLASSANIVDVCVYDTRFDSDGGAWRKRCAHTSWENEALGTSTRGLGREFPAVCVIVAETNKITIFDATDPDLAMWMVFNGGASNPTPISINDIAMRDGKMVVASGGDGLFEFDFIRDYAARRWITSGYEVRGGKMADRNTVVTGATKITPNGIVSNVCYDVVFTVLPGAPLDTATDLPVPTIAVATAGGTSIIHNNGSVVDVTGVLSGAEAADGFVTFTESGTLYIGDRKLADGTAAYLVGFTTLPTADVSISTADIQHDSTFSGALANTVPYVLGFMAAISDGGGDGVFVGGSAGLTFFDENKVKPELGMAAYITKDYNTGWMPGDIRGCFLANSKTADRSWKGNALTENGTVTESVVEAGAGLKGYSGFSDSNYLNQAYDADFDFGASDLCGVGWFKMTSTSDSFETILDRADAGGTGPRFLIQHKSDSTLRFYISDTVNSVDINSTQIVDDGKWHFCVAVNDQTNDRVLLYLDGELVASVASAGLGSMSNGSAELRLGYEVADASPFTRGVMALWRISAFAPSAKQVAKMYADEKWLFRENAECLIGGVSGAVAALAYDKSSDQLAVATADGTSFLRGLERVNYIDAVADTNLTSDDHNAVAAASGVYLIGSAAEAVATLPERNIRSDLMQGVSQKPKPVMAFDGVTADATPTVIWSLPVFEGEELDIAISVRAREAVDSPSERASYSKRATVYRDVGGDVTLVGVDDLATDRETTGTMDCTIDVDTGTQLLRVKVTGVAATDIEWTGSAKLTGGVERWAA